MNDLLHRMARVRVPYHHIALSLGLSLNTLISLHGHEIQRIAIAADLEIRETLFAMAKSGTNTAATIFWLKNYGGPQKEPSPNKTKQPDRRKPSRGYVRFIGPNGEVLT